MISKINTSMDSTAQKNPQMTDGERKRSPKTKPDDQGNFAVLGHIKIFDPNTKQVYVETRE